MHRFVKWRDTLQIAPNTQAVYALMCDYLDTIRPLMGALPAECQAILDDPKADIQAKAVSLLQCELAFRGSEEVREFLHEVAHTFAAASVRITSLHRPPLVSGD